MSEFSQLCTDTVLWDPTSIATWGSLNFCLLIQWFNVHTIKQTQLTTLLQIGAWGEHGKAQEWHGLPPDST